MNKTKINRNDLYENVKKELESFLFPKKPNEILVKKMSDFCFFTGFKFSRFHFRNYVMTDKCQLFGEIDSSLIYRNFKENGWSDHDLITNGFMINLFNPLIKKYQKDGKNK